MSVIKHVMYYYIKDKITIVKKLYVTFYKK